MLRSGAYTFKRATSADEFEQVHALNYRTFVDEVAQHAGDGSGRLIDKFHVKNAYFVALHHQAVVGMICVHDQPPFSVAGRLADPSILSAPGAQPLEVRLLAVDAAHRHGLILGGLMWMVYQFAAERGHTHLFISGVESRVTLYREMGFEPLGPPVTCGGASFVPMGGTFRRIEECNRRRARLWLKRQARTGRTSRPEVCLLPGPVSISAAVQVAFARPPLYHRGPEFLDQFERVREALCRLTGARGVALFNGSGTLANEAVAATLSAEPRPTHGLILSNGEFGQRLVQQALGFGLSFNTLGWPWGRPWQTDEIETRLRCGGQQFDWVWGVHQESSTGVLNPLARLTELCERCEVKLCVDCVSSLGATELDLSRVYLATGASGKSLGAYAGASMVFADPARLRHLDRRRLPTYVDVPAALATPGPRFTFPSPTLAALEAALGEYATPQQAEARHQRYRALGRRVRDGLRQCGVEPLADEQVAAPVLTTFHPPGDEASEAFVARCKFWGFAVGGLSRYLSQRRLVQIATMGDLTEADLAALFDSQAFALTHGVPESPPR